MRLKNQASRTMRLMVFIIIVLKKKKMNILGLMIIPPNDNKTKEYFQSISELNSSLGFKELSMGMSSDYIDAINFKATYLRIGSSILEKEIN